MNKTKEKYLHNENVNIEEETICIETREGVSLQAVILKKKNRTDEIFNRLVDAIVSLKIMPGEKLSENRLSAIYGVSRTIIRSALLKLSDLKFVEIKAKSGTFVTKMDMEYIRASLIVRLALEKQSCMKIMRDEEERKKLLSKLKKIYTQQTKCMDHKNYTKVFAKLDTDFHNCILDAIDEGKMTDIIKPFLLHINRWRNYAVEKSIGIYKILNEHKRIIDMLQEKNQQGLLDILDIHINKTMFNIGKNNKEFWDYFK